MFSMYIYVCVCVCVFFFFFFSKDEYSKSVIILLEGRENFLTR